MLLVSSIRTSLELLLSVGSNADGLLELVNGDRWNTCGNFFATCLDVVPMELANISSARSRAERANLGVYSVARPATNKAFVAECHDH